MSVSSYEKDGKTLWRVYINIRSKNDPAIREQKTVTGLESEKAALTEERKLYREVTDKLMKRASDGLTWEEVLGRWELAMFGEPDLGGYQRTTILDHVARLTIWTACWLKRPAAELNRGDAKQVFKNLEQEGKSREFQRKIKHTVNVVYDWGIENRLIRGVVDSPMRGLKLTVSKSEKTPDILTLDEIRVLLREAKRNHHPWYPIWAIALLTGMRSGELYALEWSDVDLENERITVSKSYHTRGKVVKSTKNGRWRTIPINVELQALLKELKATDPHRKHVLPHMRKWSQGMQAEVLRTYCLGIGIRPVCFHALRACFATQLLGNNIPPASVMKICGWEGLKTMQHYVRLAGIDEKGITAPLKFLPEREVMGEVVELFHSKNSG